MVRMILCRGHQRSKFWTNSANPAFLSWTWQLCLLFIILTEVSGICVWQGGGGFRLACGFKQSGLLRMRSLGGLKGWAGAGFTIGDEDGFKDSLTNTESKSRGIASHGNQYRPQQSPVPIQQYGQYSNVALNQGQQYQHESENLQKRASLWNSWKWPSIIKKKSPNRASPQRAGPIPGMLPQHGYAHAPMPIYSQQQRRPPLYPHPMGTQFPQPSMQFPQFQTYPQPIPSFPQQRFPGQYPGFAYAKKPELAGFSPMPELDPLLKEASEEESESQIETVLKALKMKAEKQRRKETKLKKPYGLQLLENSANYGTKFQVSENSVPAEDEVAESSVTGYDTNLFPDIYFTSTTPRDKIKKMLGREPEEDQQNNVDEESTTEAILRKLRLKKIKLLKKGHKLKITKPKASKEEFEATAKIEQTTPSKVPSTTQELTTLAKVSSTTPKVTTPSTTSTLRSTTTTQVPTTTTEKPKPPMIMRTRPTARPDYAESFYRDKSTEHREVWKEFTPRPSPSARPYTPIAQNPLVLSGKWKDIYDPRFPPEHEVNRGKLELLAAALTTTSQRPKPNYREIDEEPEEYLPKPPSYYRDEYPRIPEYPYRDPFPKRIESRSREDTDFGLPSQVRVEGRDDGQFVRFDSRESFNLVNRTKSYNDAFYSHFNKSAIEMAENQPNPTPFHYFSAFFNQNSTPKMMHPPIDPWDRSPSVAHFSRNGYLPSSTPTPRPMPPAIAQWAGLGRYHDSGSIEDFRPKLDHSLETGDLLRQKATFFTANREPGRGILDRSIERGHPNFVTDDNFQFAKYPYPPQESRTSMSSVRPPTTLIPITNDYYYSSTPSFNEWKNYVGVASGISSTTSAPPPTEPRLNWPERTPRPDIPHAQPQFRSPENKNATEKVLEPKKAPVKTSSKVKPEVRKSKPKIKPKKVTTSTTVKTTTPQVTTTAPPLPPATSTKVTIVSEPEDDESEEYSQEETSPEETVSRTKGEMANKHPKKPAAAAFLPVSGPGETLAKAIVTSSPHLSLEPPSPPPRKPAVFPNQNLGPPPPPPDFATSHLNEFPQGSVHHFNIQTDWNLHPLPTEPPAPPQTTKMEVTLQGKYDFAPPPPPTINPNFQQRQSPMPPESFPRNQPWSNQGPPMMHHPHHPFHGQIPYPPPRPFSQQYPAPQNQGLGPQKAIRHMLPGRPPVGPGPVFFQRGPPMANSLIGVEQHSPPRHFPPMAPPNHPQIRPVQMDLSPPPVPPPQIIPSTKAPTTTSSTTTSTTQKPAPSITQEEQNQRKEENLVVDERDMIMKALQTLTRAKTHVLHSVVNEKYGGDVAGIVKVVPEIPTQFRPTPTTTTARPTTVKLTTTTQTPTTTVATRIVFDEIPSKFVPLVNYVKNLKVPTYENDNVQIDYFNFKDEKKKEEPKPPKLPAVLGMNIDDLALLASVNHQVKVAPSADDATKFEEMLRSALASKMNPTPSQTTIAQNPSPTPTTLVETLTQMGIMQKLHDRNVTSTQIDTLKKLIQLNKFQERVDSSTVPPAPSPSPAAVQLMHNFRHILSHMQQPSPNMLGHRISHIDPSMPVQQFLPPVPSTTPRPFNSLYSAINGPTLQALKAIALNQIQNVQPTPQINLPQQTASEESSEQIAVDLSPLLALAENTKKSDQGMRFLKVRNAPKSYYPGERILPFSGSKEVLTGFHCERQEFFPGLYGDQSNSCKVFHLCAKTDAGYLTKTFRCPEGTLFDQEVLRCNWSMYVNCQGVEGKYHFNKYLSQSFQFLKSLGEFSASVQPKNSTMSAFG